MRGLEYGFCWIKLMLVFLFLCPGNLFAKKSFDSGRVSFSVQCNDMVLGYKIQSVFLLPEETITLSVVDADWNRKYFFTSQDGKTDLITNREWKWTAPAENGIYQAVLHQVGSEKQIMLNLFVMIPFEQVENGILKGYKIGFYPKNKRGEVLVSPKGFVEVTEENQYMHVTPHFTLNQFVSRQKSDYPKYVVIDERLLEKLELVLHRLNLKGHKCRVLTISSAFRTPYYNKKLGNTPHSLHLWGMAADLLVDNDNDGIMDDLNRDGKHDMKDSEVLKSIVREVEGEIRHYDKIGGIGTYKETENHGPFIHMDVRGDYAEW